MPKIEETRSRHADFYLNVFGKSVDIMRKHGEEQLAITPGDIQQIKRAYRWARDGGSEEVAGEFERIAKRLPNNLRALTIYHAVFNS